jgi:hypothetical protein
MDHWYARDPLFEGPMQLHPALVRRIYDAYGGVMEVVGDFSHSLTMSHLILDLGLDKHGYYGYTSTGRYELYKARLGQDMKHREQGSSLFFFLLNVYLFPLLFRFLVVV